MARNDKVLDILALAKLPDGARIARLAHRWVNKPFDREQARAVVKCYFDDPRRVGRLTQALMNEKARQERLRTERVAVKAAMAAAALSPMARVRACGLKVDAYKNARIMEIAMATFGQHVKDNFNSDTLVMMSLINGEDRVYAVRWLDAGLRPVRCATIEVCISSPSKETSYAHFLLYKTNGRVLVARTEADSVEEAWSGQLPEEFLTTVSTLVAAGYRFRSDLEAQEMVVISPEGEERRVQWLGRTVDE